MLWNGIQGAAGVLDANAVPDTQPTVVVVTGSGNFASLTTASDAVGTLRNVGAPVYAIGLEGDRLDTGGLQDVVTRAGGRLVTTPDSEQLDELGTEMAQAIDQQYVLAYDPPTGDDAGAVADIQLQVGEATTSASFVRGSQTTKPADLFAQTVASNGDGLLQSDLAKYVGVVLVLFAAGLGAFALIMLTQNDDSHLTNVLQPYAEGFLDETVEADDDEGALAKTALIQRAVEMTEDFAERQGFLAGVEAKLERADLPLRAAEALFFYGAMVAVVGLLSLVLTRSLIGTVFCTFLAALLPSCRGELQGQAPPEEVQRPAPRHAPAAVRHAAGRLLAHAGRRGRVPGGRGPDRLRAAPGRDRVPPGPPARGGPRRRGRADGQPRLPVGRHGHRDPARGRRQPGRAADDGRRHHGAARAPAP